MQTPAFRALVAELGRDSDVALVPAADSEPVVPAAVQTGPPVAESEQEAPAAEQTGPPVAEDSSLD